MRNFYTPYHYLFYIIYKFIKLTTKKEDQHLVAESTLNLMIICLTNNIAAMYIYSGIIKYLPDNIYLSVLIFSVAPISLYVISRLLFIRDNSFIDVANYYDKTNDLTKRHFILIGVLYAVVSLGTMILAGIYYTR